MTVVIERFTLYKGAKGNALAFADVVVRERGHAYKYRDVKLYSDGIRLRVSPRQLKSEHGWAYAYLIPRAFQGAIRRALIERYKAEKTGQLALVL